MQSKTGYWFEVIVRLEKMLDDGSTKKVNETYVIEAMSFSEAEKRIMNEVGKNVRGDIEVKKISPAAYKEVVFSDNRNDGHWFKAKVSFITLNEKTGKEKRRAAQYLVQADTFDDAVSRINEFMVITGDYLKATVTETKIVEVFENNK